MFSIRKATKKDLPAYMKGLEGGDVFVATGLPDTEADFDEKMIAFCKRHHKEDSGFFVSKILCKPELHKRLSEYDPKIVNHLVDLTTGDVGKTKSKTIPVWRYRSGLGIADFIGAK